MTTNKALNRIFWQILLITMAIVVVIPFLWMISTSFKSDEAVHTIPIRWFPKEPSLEGYRSILTLTNVNFVRAFINSIAYSIVRTTGQVLCSAMAAFIFAKVSFKGRNILFMLVLSTMMMPGTVVMIPNYLILKNLGLLNTYTGLIIPSLLEGLFIFILRQFMVGIDDSYLEAVLIDGASLPFCFRKIVLPLSRPALFTLVLFGFMGSWNDYLWPLIILSRKSKWTLQVALGVMNTQFGNSYHVMMAGALISIVPIVLVYILTQKYVEEGVAQGGVKS